MGMRRPLKDCPMGFIYMTSTVTKHFKVDDMSLNDNDLLEKIKILGHDPINNNLSLKAFRHAMIRVFVYNETIG
jgi:hypothetical protein